MSIRIMSQVWDLQLPDSEKLVLLALADCANDEGRAWPSIASLARKCSRGERTIQIVLRSLEAAGHLRREEIPGRGCIYDVTPCATPAVAAPHPRSGCTPAENAPAQGTTETPAVAAPHPRSGCTQSVKEPSITIMSARVARRPARPARGSRLPDGWSQPDPSGASGQIWKRWPRDRRAQEDEAFRNYWRAVSGSRGVKQDWDATWRNWVINSERRHPHRDRNDAISPC